MESPEFRYTCQFDKERVNRMIEPYQSGAYIISPAVQFLCYLSKRGVVPGLK